MRRIAYVGDFTGKAIEHTLTKRCKKEKNITIFIDTFAVKILVDSAGAYGVEVATQNSTRTNSIYADTIILATGGAGQVYEHTTNPTISTGDGIAMAHSLGAQIHDMEFVQFHPTAFTHKGKTKFLLSEALRGEGAYLKNNRDERFMQKYDTRKELAPRDIVARAIYEEEKNGPVYLDLRHLNPDEVHTRFPSLTEKLKKYSLDLARDLIPISPAAHYLCGGVVVDLHGRTSVKNVYAFGEVTCTGVHGANRLASNSLLEAVVFARAATKDILLVHKRKNRPKNEKHTHLKIPNSSEVRLVRTYRKNIKKIMWECVGVVRTKENLEQALLRLLEIQNSVAQMPQSLLKIETQNMIVSALLITKAALNRKTSLGCHYRLS